MTTMVRLPPPQPTHLFLDYVYSLFVGPPDGVDPGYVLRLCVLSLFTLRFISL